MNFRGSTPAHAGNTIHTCARPVITPVYPRPRGEYFGRYRERRPLIGLPPPTRGIRDDYDLMLFRGGSTPAHAGNTDGLSASSTYTWVYPRPRGEYDLAKALPRR